ncbi:hypothetical protein [Blastomonas sp.]|uniref:hypothetical protein n=1 Tax=Blastomonas sp. TaxID=1909299 RepID=UPI0035939DD8
MNPITLLTLQAQTTRLMLDKQAVMALRLMGMSGAIRARPDENFVMMAEKGPAMLRALVAGTAALMAGHGPDRVLSAAIKPLAREVRANRKRLMK